MAGAVCVVGVSSSDLRHSPIPISIARIHVAAARLDLTTSFLHTSSSSSSCCSRTMKKKKKLSIVGKGGFGGQYEDSYEDVKSQIVDYFTYKAVRTVLNQLYEMNPPQYRWFYNYIASNEHGFGKTFIRKLVKDQLELAQRVMKCDHVEMYERISDQNLELMRERLIQTVIWPSDDTNTEVVG
ncbi:chaperonin-like RbcX protein 2, chloroplastic isoform X2 [Salvia hispanica]|uniref:chaperonin-like RbcX protein 2, chloroplastic isoform X2 n=1 Tax=Salvia hispanica TaxID=49212 RepID=UPI0020092F80|nr:chaperonin-like RbcX protein 2, chloroplastic isoform X2 [Salvia hispanica]